MYFKLYKAIEDRLNYVWKELVKELEPYYEEVSSCNKDKSRYLVPRGTKDQITYYSKPAFSLRISDHWSWYANIRKCNDENYVQCSNIMFSPNPREKEGCASKPIKSLQICIADDDGMYHPLIGFMNEMSEDSIDTFVDKPVNQVICDINNFIDCYR